MYKQITIYLLFIILFSACSSKKYYSPENSSSIKSDFKSLPSSISSFNKNFATLEDGSYLTEDGLSKEKLPQGYELLNIKDKIVLASNKNKELLIKDREKQEILTVDENVISASKKDNLLALIFTNNTLVVYDIDTKKYIFKDYQKESYANDTRFTNPIFMSNIVLFPTLDGKIVVVSLDNMKVIRNIVVDTNDKFNNIIFFEIIDETLVAATNNKLIAVSSNSLNVKDYEVRDIMYKNSFIYLATIDGRIIKLDNKLNELKSIKFKYAKFHSLLIKDDTIYAFESQGYLIKVDNNFTKTEIYDISFDEEEKSFSKNEIMANKKFYLKID